MRCPFQDRRSGSLHAALFTLALLCLGLTFSISAAEPNPSPQAPSAPGSATPASADAQLPAGTSLNWDKLDLVTVNAKRSQAPLNGLWRFIPAQENAPEPPRSGWAYIKVPGSWQPSRGRAADFVAVGTGPLWQEYDGSKVARAWYERQVTIPTDWQGRAISLRFDHLSTDAIVFVNRRECGRVAWPWGTVDITSAVQPGEKAEIRVLVAAIADAEEVGTFWQNAFSNVSYRAATLRTRGLTGRVFLESRATEAHVSDVFVRTSTRKREVALDIEFKGVKQAGPVRIVADMVNEQGDIEKSFAADATAAAGETQTLTVSWPWANPRLWEVRSGSAGSAALYTLHLRVTGAQLDDEVEQKFGFREFWVDGRQFYLNGSVIRFRQPCFYNGPRGQVGDNFSEMGDSNVDQRGDTADSGRSLDEADRDGYLVAQYVLNANKYMMNRGRMVWDQNRQRALERAAVWMRHYRNHPSVVLWIAGFNFFNNAVDADPRHIGRGGWDIGDERWHRLVLAGKQMFDDLKQLDPTRAYYSHAGADTGDVYTMNCYLDLLPIQEREDWLIAWAESGQMPVSMVEFGTPMDCTFRRGRHGFESNITSEPLLTEFAAIYFGAGAYAAEETKYRQYLHDLFRSGMLYQSSENRLDEYANEHKLQQLYRVNTWRSWRTAGLQGGLRTWSWMQDALKEVNSPTLAWIAGPSGAYTAKDHHFRPGQRFEKQVVLINDTRQPQGFTMSWMAQVGGQAVSQGRSEGQLAVSEIRFIPIQVSLPAGGPADHPSEAAGEITLSATIGQTSHRDAFAFSIIPEQKPNPAEIELVDPSGRSRPMLEALGYQTGPWSAAVSPQTPFEAGRRLVVIGCNALRDDPSLTGKLEPFVREGGRALILEQDPEWLTRALGWRVCPKVARRIFPVESSTRDSALASVTADDLRDWTGSSTLLEAFPSYVGEYLRGNEREQPYAGWRWGSRGGVSSAAIEKPHRSGWRPLLECEFDLAYTPLMELDYGQGRVVICTCDLEDHVAQDPAARRLGAQVIEYALKSPLAPRASRAVYLGGENGAAWLNRVGVRFERAANLAEAAEGKRAELLLVGPEVALESTALSAYLGTGGRVFFLPGAQAEGPLGATRTRAAAHFAGATSVPGWPEARGLSASDLRWRSYLDDSPWVLSGGVEVGADGLIGRKSVGKGVALFCQVDPDGFHADEKTYLRYSRWRATRAVSQLLADLGASFETDAGLFHPLEIGGELSSSVGPNGDQSGPQATFAGAHRGEPKERSGPASFGYYHPDYRTDFPMGDNPYRYYRW